MSATHGGLRLTAKHDKWATWLGGAARSPCSDTHGVGRRRVPDAAAPTGSLDPPFQPTPHVNVRSKCYASAVLCRHAQAWRRALPAGTTGALTRGKQGSVCLGGRERTGGPGSYDGSGRRIN